MLFQYRVVPDGRSDVRARSDSLSSMQNHPMGHFDELSALERLDSIAIEM
jgi:hypothetical protein